MKLFGLDPGLTILDVKRHFHRQLDVSRFRLRLVDGECILDDNLVLGDIPQPFTLTLVKLPINQDLNLFNALKAAASTSNGEVEMLLHRQANPDRPECKVSFNATPLQVAATCGNSKAVRVLCEAGAEKDHYGLGFTALGLAAQYGHMAVVRALHECSTNMDGICSQGNSPLSIAAQNGRLEVVRYLCGIGANLENRTGLSPLKAALECGHYRVAFALRVSGAQPLWGAKALLIEGLRRQRKLLTVLIVHLLVLAVGLLLRHELVSACVVSGLTAVRSLRHDAVGSKMTFAQIVLISIVFAACQNTFGSSAALIVLAWGTTLISPCAFFVAFVACCSVPGPAQVFNFSFHALFSVVVSSI